MSKIINKQQYWLLLKIYIGSSTHCHCEIQIWRNPSNKKQVNPKNCNNNPLFKLWKI